MAKNIESRIAQLERQHNGTGYKLALRADGETDDEALTRAGLVGWTGAVVFCSEIDARL